MTNEYSKPVCQLLAYGGYASIQNLGDPWPNYLELGLAEDHISELTRMISDKALNNANGESSEVWAPLHAWRALGQLKAVEASESLVRLYQTLPDDDWLSSELPKVFSLIGPAAIPAIQRYLSDDTVDEFCKIGAPSCLEMIALNHPGHRADCIAVLEDQLSAHKTNGNTFNAYLILALVQLQAKEAIEAIKAAFKADLVDLSVMGDLEDAEIELGLRSHRETPRPKIQWIPELLARTDEDQLDPTLKGTAANSITNPLKHIGRNDPCPCGSGKKFKKCCLN